MNVVLVNPEIPQNTGNIGRLCVATGSTLHLVGELGFSLDDYYVRRAGIDHWEQVRLIQHASYERFSGWVRQARADAQVWYFSTHGERLYTDVAFDVGDFLVFGCESTGLPGFICERAQKAERLLRIPVLPSVRSLNLANAVAIVLYEAFRKLSWRFPDDDSTGHGLTRTT